MANQHHPSESGRRPLKNILEKMPTCDPCSWAFWVAEGRFLLKVLNPNCQLHRNVLTDLDEPPPLEAWLGVA